MSNKVTRVGGGYVCQENSECLVQCQIREPFGGVECCLSGTENRTGGAGEIEDVCVNCGICLKGAFLKVE